MTTREISAIAANNGALVSNVFTGNSALIGLDTVRHPVGTRSIERVIEEATARGLLECADRPELSLREVREQVSQIIEDELAKENAERDKGNKLRKPGAFSMAEFVKIVVNRADIIHVYPGGQVDQDGFSTLAVYQDSGEGAGTYGSRRELVEALLMQMGGDMTKNKLLTGYHLLKNLAPPQVPNSEPHLVPMNNGVFNTETKQLEPHSPKRFFLGKSPVDYVEAPVNPVITMPDGELWDVESWLQSLHPHDSAATQLLWELLSALLRRQVSWNKVAFFHGTEGANGKGTLSELMRHLVGKSNVTTVALHEFGDRFALGKLTNKTAIIVDENRVGGYLEYTDKIKALITGDEFSIERKHEPPGVTRFQGVMIQCINDMILSRDKSNSFIRRLLFVPFKGEFEDTARDYIKNDYIRRPRVLQYVAYRALHMEHTKLSEPESSKLLLEEFKSQNDPVLLFWQQHSSLFTWDLLPYDFLYEMFEEWKKKAGIETRISRMKFTRALRYVLKKCFDWEIHPNNSRYTTGNSMSVPEPLIAEYELLDWMNPYQSQTRGPRDIDRQCTPLSSQLERQYRGVRRKVPLIPDPKDTGVASEANGTASGVHANPFDY